MLYDTGECPLAKVLTLELGPEASRLLSVSCTKHK
jgi:hypothetical protein